MMMKRFALHLYLEGLGFRSIGRILGVSNVSVLKWIRAFGEQAESIRTEQNIAVVELDELHTYIGQKNVTVGYGLLLIDMGNDSSHSYWVTGE
jgi:outer membrane scaffolding protein for murein synthesis (MipA/OmpV family)